MNLPKNNVIFEAEIEPFSRRLWKACKSYFILYLIAVSLLIYFNYQNDSFITKGCIILVLIFMVSYYKSAVKWTKTKIERISYSEDLFEFQIVEKDLKKNILIPKDNLSAILKWTESRPPVLKLTILNNESEQINTYSAGKKELEFELEKISFELNKII